MPLEIGIIVSHYRILEKIGSGGMSEVYKAEDLKLKRPVALKFLSPILTASEVSKKRFINEAQAASTLDHPNICTIFEINKTDDDQMFIAMGYYDGETLDKKISAGPLEIQQAINITIQTADGISKAHQTYRS